jgi:hypothetical protein
MRWIRNPWIRSRVTCEQKATADRLGAFSDAVIAVIITIMVLSSRRRSRRPEVPSLRF